MAVITKIVTKFFGWFGWGESVLSGIILLYDVRIKKANFIKKKKGERSFCMSFKNQLTNDMKEAMKAKDTVRLGVVRFLLSAIKNAEIDKGQELTDEEAQKIVAKQIKQMKDAIEQFKAGDRPDLVEAEEAKIKVLEAYLPAQLSQAELEKIIDEVISQVGEVKNPGQVIGLVMKQVAGRADGKQVAQLVTAKIQNQQN